MSGERTFIEGLRAIAAHPAARGLLDDAAVLEIGGETLILTHDVMVEGVHALPGQDMADIAWKLVATNLSDLAAKGAQPLGVLVGYTLGHGDAAFLEGLRDALAHYAVPLLGGDTVSGPSPRSFGLTAIGRATHIPVPSRSGARVGDGLYLTGPVGAAMIGCEALRDGTGGGTEDGSLAYRRPTALLAQGRALARHVTAMMDVSDGLLLDASRMASASGLGFAIDSAAVPIATPEDRRADALRWGDDYQLLFTASPDADLPVAASLIGHAVDAAPGAIILDGRMLPADEPLGYEHGRSG